MKRYYLILAVLCTALIAGCNKEIDDVDFSKDDDVSLMDGSIIISNNPDLRIVHLNNLLKSVSAGDGSIVRTNADDPVANEYRFKLVAEMSTLTVDDVDVQASHVKFTDDGYVFVSYNKKHGPRTGGVIVYRYTIVEGETLEDVQVTVEVVTSMVMTEAQVNALDLYDGKVYIAGSSTDERLGYTSGFDCAFLMVMELNPDKTFKPVDPKAIIYLTSFQATSISVVNDLVYVTTGDGTNGTYGGLHIYNATDYSRVKTVLDLNNARSVAVDDANIFMMQADPARITKFDLNGNSANEIYRNSNEALQKDAKSEMIVWRDYLFVAQNESGLRMLSKTNGQVNASLNRPGLDPEDDVTNSVTLNDGNKKSNEGKSVQTNMLLLANGGMGLWWYDVMKDDNGRDRIVRTENNSILGGGGPSTNFVESRGNLVFVADGLGGLKVLYFEVIPAETEKEPDTATVIFTGVKDDEDGTYINCDELLSIIVELDKEGEIDWDAVYQSYNDQSCFDFNDDWVIGWEVGGRRFNGKRPNIVFTEDMVDENGEIHIVAIIEKNVTVRFAGLIDKNGIKYPATGELYSQTVELGKMGEINWNEVYNSYNSQTWETGFHKEWVVAWVVNKDYTIFEGKEPANPFTRAMLEEENEIVMYALIEPVVTVVFTGLKYDNSDDYIPATSHLYSQVVKLNEANNIAWSDVFSSYAVHGWPTFFNENRVTGWITATAHVLRGRRSDDVLTKEMIHDKDLNEIHLYAIITPTVSVWCVGIMDPDGNVLEGPQVSELPNSWMQYPGPHSLTIELGAQISEVGWNAVFESYRNVQWPKYNEEFVIGWRTEAGVTFNGAMPDAYFTSDLRNVKIWDNTKAYVIIMYAVISPE